MRKKLSLSHEQKGLTYRIFRAFHHSASGFRWYDVRPSYSAATWDLCAQRVETGASEHVGTEVKLFRQLGTCQPGLYLG